MYHLNEGSLVIIIPIIMVINTRVIGKEMPGIGTRVEVEIVTATIEITPTMAIVRNEIPIAKLTRKANAFIAEKLAIGNEIVGKNRKNNLALTLVIMAITTKEMAIKQRDRLIRVQNQRETPMYVTDARISRDMPLMTVIMQHKLKDCKEPFKNCQKILNKDISLISIQINFN